ncbi:hypothetical protein [Marinobacter xiaoshiensis]|uniref:DUF1585 domain-containing protein n=1 Tax=Marinobacter xiaoshiensis TaxID=3073652 RepID=A0ABU2HGL1_9GAMM|nr:hypothetical protein [Marinobacter sp. F60267]MDS1309755.1 hypothetical protein [Marinobacter sp. F60267]
MKAKERMHASAFKACSMSLLILLTATFTCTASAGPREQAKRIHDRIAGVPPSASRLDDMTREIEANRALNAAFTAMEDRAFYNVTLKNFAAPWTNEAMTPFVPLNDYTATVIGLVRDDADFRRVLYDDILYVGTWNDVPTYSNSNNDHYEMIEKLGHDLSDKQNFRGLSQSSVTGLPTDATAGVITSRAAARAFFSAGTNRAMFRFTLINHMCRDLEQVADVNLPPDRIRQDVSRSPGGDSRVFLNNCVGCHTGMDPMTQAFAYYDYEYNPDSDPDGMLGRLVYNTVNDPETQSRVQGKYLINSTTFAPGYVTPDDKWDNYWRQGTNRRLDWDGSLPGSGHGAKSLGEEWARSGAFAECQVKKVFTNICLRPPSTSADHTQIEAMVSSFRSHNYNLKQVFAESAVYCAGE